MSGADDIDGATSPGELPDWQSAEVIKVVPDRAQEPVRRLAGTRQDAVYGCSEAGTSGAVLSAAIK